MAYRNSVFRGGKMAESRIAWARTILGVTEVRQYPQQDDEIPIGPDVTLIIPTTGSRKPVMFNLTTCTEPELVAIKKMIDLAIDLAMPEVKHRDEVARNAKDEGDDSYARVYRRLPEVVVREGKILPHGQRLHDGPEDVSSGPGGIDGGSGGGVRGAGDELADPASSSPGAAYDSSEID